MKKKEGLFKLSEIDILTPTYQIYNKNCTELNWPINADLLITQLPATEKEGYSRGLVGFIANKTFFSLNNNRVIFIILSSLKEEKTRSDSVIDIFTSVGFKYIDRIIWLKNKFAPTQGGKRLNNVYDEILMFAKGSNYHLNRESIAYLKNRLHPENENEYLCPGNVWKIKIDNRDFIPYELIECIINLSNLLPNSLILDPLMGHGTTLKVSLNLGHSFWGSEMDKDRYDVCKQIVKDFNKSIKSNS